MFHCQKFLQVWKNSMKPNLNDITINDNRNKIITLLDELMFRPRLKAIQWSHITKQTPNLKIGYPAQHLASLITGIEGERTGARGNDIKDGTEVKSCSRVDQLDTCKNCNGKVLRIEEECPHCSSKNIDRKKDSKWLFSVKDEGELDLLLNKTKRVLLILADYPNFSENDFNTIQIQGFEIWPQSQRNQNFKKIVTDYFENIFSFHINKNASKTPAPLNFWPDLIQFYLCNPIKVFECIVSDVNNDPNISIVSLIAPEADRNDLPSVSLPTRLIKADEWEQLKAIDCQVVKDNLINPEDYDTFIKCEKSQNVATMRKIFKEELNEDFKNLIIPRSMRAPRETGKKLRKA